MAHCPFTQLVDLKIALDEVRRFAGIKEIKPGIFYLKSKSFLHFHISGNRRWADIRDGKDWGSEIDIPFGSSARFKRNFLEIVKARYTRTVNGK